MKLALPLWTLLVALVVAAPAPAAQSDNGTLGTPNGTGSTINRPIVIPGPYPPSVPFPNPPGRTRVCTVKTNGGGVDDSQNILDAFNKCNNGGHVIFPTNTTYTIGKTMDWSFLRSIDIEIQGTLKWTDNIDYWTHNNFNFAAVQNQSTFFKLGGDDVFIYGGGTLDGSGQAWYDAFATNPAVIRPVLVGIDGLKNSIISNINLRYSPSWYHVVANATNVVFDTMTISGKSTSKNIAKNTDGWDTFRSSALTIQNSIIDNGDDCVAFKPNSTDIVVQNLHCNGSHGISVGSLGQYYGEYDIVENVLVSDIVMTNASDGARIKIWPGMAPTSTGLTSGGGSGHVKNVTYQNVHIENVDYAIEITQCYGATNLTVCSQYPSSLVIEDIVFRNFTGNTSKKYQPNVASFSCSSPEVCFNIHAIDINVSSPNGSHSAFCYNQDAALLGGICSA
ncbi:Exopolygalacturonase [Saitozyma sp. JCM 24511]|nr:Exopolygalacturonase [Saitozyma sp. JCM 24511]